MISPPKQSPEPGTPGSGLLFGLRAGGAREVRTPDFLLAKQALSRLSYGPVMVGLAGVEPATSPLSGVRSNLLSYRPVAATAVAVFG